MNVSVPASPLFTLKPYGVMTKSPTPVARAHQLWDCVGSWAMKGGRQRHALRSGRALSRRKAGGDGGLDHHLLGVKRRAVVLIDDAA